MNKEISVAFISQKIKEEWEVLQEGKFQDKQLYEFIKRAIDDLKSNPTCGIKIPKYLWPIAYVQKFGITN
ncbi:hypothetical protein HYU13_01020, partial [Candidatus Woesearchaeota archaeon]|nr:hypothetical protein [Candidatus Woesearchaeota archaeon]